MAKRAIIIVLDSVGAGEMPDAAAYYVDFASARWSLDAAGISLLISVTLTVVIFAKIVFTLTVKIILGIRTRRLKKT